MKFFLGLLPMENASSRIDGPYRVNAEGAPLALGLQLRINAYAAGISYRLEASTNLTNWVPVPYSVASTPTGIDGSRYVFVSETTAAADPKRFVRIAVSLNP